MYAAVDSSIPAGTNAIGIALLEREPGMRLSISYTTRPPRPGELDGRDYHFLSVVDFERRIAAVNWPRDSK